MKPKQREIQLQLLNSAKGVNRKLVLTEHGIIETLLALQEEQFKGDRHRVKENYVYKSLRK